MTPAPRHRPPLQPAPEGPVAFGPFVLDAAEARLLTGGQVVPLAGRPMQLLALLAAQPGQLLTKDEVLDAVWGHAHVADSTLKVVVNTVRAALQDDARAPRYIETVSRRGYRFVAAVRVVGTATAAATPAEAPPAASVPAPAAAGNLPPPGEPLLGRDDLWQRLVDLQRTHRLVTLTGLGGVGKTRLALALAAHAVPADGAWLVRLDEVSDPSQLVPTLAGTLKLGAAAAGGAPALARALAALDTRLLLDNAEHLVDEVAALVATLRQQAPRLQLLVTSQLPLRLAGEQVVPVPPLALPADVGDAEPDPQGYAAAQLLCARVRQLRPGWEPTLPDFADVAAICRALDGVPLALELAAARVPLMGLAGVRARLDDRFALLTRAPRDATLRHRTLQAALEWTHDLLDPHEQDALGRLAVFAGSFTLASAEAVLTPADGAPDAPPALDRVDALMDRSLLESEPDAAGAPRLRLYDSVRRFALDRLRDRQAEHVARARHLQRMRDLALQAERDAFSQPTRQWLPPLRPYLDSLRGALSFGLVTAAGDPALRDDAQQLAAAAVVVWQRLGARRELQHWLERARSLPAQPATALLLDYAWAYHMSHSGQTDLPQALALAERVAQTLADAGDAQRAYLASFNAAQLALRVRPGVRCSAWIAAMERQVQPGWNAVSRRVLANLRALDCRQAGDLPGFTAIFRDTARDLRALGCTSEAWVFDMGHAQGLTLLGQRAPACALLAACLESLRSAGELREQLTVVAMNAALQLWEGTPDAVRTAREAARLLEVEGMVWWLADALAWAAWHQGRTADAHRLMAWADDLLGRRNEKRGPVFAAMRADLADAMRVASSPAEDHPQPLPDEAAAVALALGAP